MVLFLSSATSGKRAAAAGLAECMDNLEDPPLHNNFHRNLSVNHLTTAHIHTHTMPLAVVYSYSYSSFVIPATTSLLCSLLPLGLFASSRITANQPHFLVRLLDLRFLLTIHTLDT